MVETGKTVEAVPRGNTYPAGAITIPASSKIAGHLTLYEKNDVSNSFHTYGQADIYVDGVLLKTIIYDPIAGALADNKVTPDMTTFVEDF